MKPRALPALKFFRKKQAGLRRQGKHLKRGICETSAPWACLQFPTSSFAPPLQQRGTPVLQISCVEKQSSQWQQKKGDLVARLGPGKRSATSKRVQKKQAKSNPLLSTVPCGGAAGVQPQSPLVLSVGLQTSHESCLS